MELNNINDFEDNYNSSQAIQWYTRPIFVYKLINKALRTDDIKQLYIFRFFLSDICLNLRQLQERTPLESHPKLYRGTRLPCYDLMEIFHKCGHLISLNGFLSTSKNIEVAHMFAGTHEAKNVQRQNDTEIMRSVLFEIEIDYNVAKEDLPICADITDLSHIQEEEEILFDFATVFEVCSVTTDSEEEEYWSDTTALWRIQLKTTDRGNKLVHDYIELNRLETAESNNIIVFGQLLADMGLYNYSRRHFRYLLNNYSQSQLEELNLDKGLILFHIGRSYELLCKIPEAENYSKQALNLQMNSQSPTSRKNLARILNNMGSLFQSRNMLKEALKYYGRAMKLLKYKTTTQNIVRAQILNNIGNVYQVKHMNKRALKYYFRALAIQEEILPAGHQHIARCLNNISNVYKDRNDLERSMLFKTRAQNMRQMILRPDHPEYLFSEASRNIVFNTPKDNYRNPAFYPMLSDVRYMT